MELILRKFGNSTGLCFPPGLLRDLGLKAGQGLTVSKTVDGLLTLAPIRRYGLQALIAQTKQCAEVPEDVTLWDMGGTPVPGLDHA